MSRQDAGGARFRTCVKERTEFCVRDKASSHSDELLSLREIAEQYNLSYSTLRGWKQVGKLPPPDMPANPDRWRRATVEKVVGVKVIDD